VHRRLVDLRMAVGPFHVRVPQLGLQRPGVLIDSLLAFDRFLLPNAVSAFSAFPFLVFVARVPGERVLTFIAA